MPQCKNCHREISKFDNDICPYCGYPHPIDDNYKTKDMTQFVDPVTGNYQLYKSKKRNVAFFLTLLLGFSGAGDFYLGYRKRGIVDLLISLAVILGGGFGLYYGVPSLGFIGFFIAFAVALIGFWPLAFKILKSDTYKDANGEFLR
jgi:hypothetical protein